MPGAKVYVIATLKLHMRCKVNILMRLNVYYLPKLLNKTVTLGHEINKVTDLVGVWVWCLQILGLFSIPRVY